MYEETENTPLPVEGDSPAKEQVDAKTKKRHAEFRQRIEICKTYRKKLLRNWTTNIDYRRGKPFSSQSDDDRISVNLDWTFTKTKQATLFSQIPQVRVAHSPESVSAGPWVANFERRLNDKLRAAGIESTMDEVLPDCINAAGIGVAMVAFESRMEDKEVPAIDLAKLPPQIQMHALQTGTIFGQPIPKKVVPFPVSSRYTVSRISPADFLWPVDFTGSDFDNAPWLGRSGRLTWAEAANRFGLTDIDKDKYLTEEKTVEDRLSHDYDREHLADDGKVGFDEIFYHTYQYDENETSFDTLYHLVFLHGKAEPVVDEPWKGQKVENGKVIGALKSPIRVLTLTYITDEDIPPSDSAIGRAQVNELNQGRTQINRQRERSIPTDWFDVNRLDPAIQQALMRGTWRAAIPVQGNGQNVIGSVQRSGMGQENFMFDKIAKADAQEQWGIGANQVGIGGDVETKGEAGIIQNNFQTKVGRERAKVAAFFVGIAQVLGGLMCLFEEPGVFGEGFDPAFCEQLGFSVLADSTVLLDSEQRLGRLNNFLDKYAKTGWVNVEPVLREIAQLIGLDPNAVIEAPKPNKPVEPNISLRLTGSEDMTNPLLLAFLIQSGQAPSPELIEKAKALIQQAVVPEPPMGGGPMGAPAAQPGAPGPLPPPPPPNIGEAMPEASLLPTIGKRSEPTGVQ
jgi:hypothetical protein